MTAPLNPIVQETDVLPAVRDLLNQYPPVVNCGPETLARRLFVLCYLDRLPSVFEVEAALGALMVEGEAVA